MRGVNLTIGKQRESKRIRKMSKKLAGLVLLGALTSCVQQKPMDARQMIWICENVRYKGCEREKLVEIACDPSTSRETRDRIIDHFERELALIESKGGDPYDMARAAEKLAIIAGAELIVPPYRVNVDKTSEETKRVRERIGKTLNRLVHEVDANVAGRYGISDIVGADPELFDDAAIRKSLDHISEGGACCREWTIPLLRDEKRDIDLKMAVMERAAIRSGVKDLNWEHEEQANHRGYLHDVLLDSRIDERVRMRALEIFADYWPAKGGRYLGELALDDRLGPVLRARAADIMIAEVSRRRKESGQDYQGGKKYTYHGTAGCTRDIVPVCGQLFKLASGNLPGIDGSKKLDIADEMPLFYGKDCGSGICSVSDLFMKLAADEKLGARIIDRCTGDDPGEYTFRKFSDGYNILLRLVKEKPRYMNQVLEKTRHKNRHIEFAYEIAKVIPADKRERAILYIIDIARTGRPREKETAAYFAYRCLEDRMIDKQEIRFSVIDVQAEVSKDESVRKTGRKQSTDLLREIAENEKYGKEVKARAKRKLRGI